MKQKNVKIVTHFVCLPIITKQDQTHKTKWYLIRRGWFSYNYQQPYVLDPSSRFRVIINSTIRYVLFPETSYKYFNQVLICRIQIIYLKLYLSLLRLHTIKLCTILKAMLNKTKRKRRRTSNDIRGITVTVLSIKKVFQKKSFLF